MATITVGELFQTLSEGPLSGLSMSNEGNGSIEDGSHNKLINYANDGLVRLYTKFLIKESELILEMQPYRTRYEIDSRYSFSGHKAGSEDPVYIIDHGSPYQNDLIKITQVFLLGKCRDVAFPLNDPERSDSLFTPKPNELQVPNPVLGTALSVSYQAKHPKLPYDNLDTQIYIPDGLIEALTSFISSKVFSHMNGAENTMKGQEHLADFNNLCNEAMQSDSVGMTYPTTNTLFDRRGWV